MHRPHRSFLFVLLICCFPAIRSKAQQNDIPLNRDIYFDIDRNGAERSSVMHTGLRPIIESRADLDHVIGHRPDSIPRDHWITRKLFQEHLVMVEDGDFRMTVDPIIWFEVGTEAGSDLSEAGTGLLGHNGRGFRIAADIGPTVSFQSSFCENQAELPDPLYRYVLSSGVVPGQGRVKNFNGRGFDFAWAMGNVSWLPKSWINVQLGQGRHFVGNGYRSVLLSDNTYPYPYVKLSAITTDKRLQYTIIQSKLQMPGEENRLPTGGAGESLFYWKRATFQHLSMRFGRMQLALFEGTMWNTIGPDGVKPYNYLQLDPVIFVNTLVNGFNGPNTQLVGMDAKWKLTDKAFVYGQFALSDPDQDGYAWQAGVQCFDLFGGGPHILLEYDHATPYAYIRDDPRMSWSQYGQPLADPLGTGFSEMVVMVDQDIAPRFRVQAEVSMARLAPPANSEDIAGSTLSGQNMRVFPDGTINKRLYTDLHVSWLVNQMSNMRLVAGWSTWNTWPAPPGDRTGYVYMGIHTGLFDRYYDI